MDSCTGHVERRGSVFVCVPCTEDSGFGIDMNGKCVRDCGGSALYKFLSVDGTKCLKACLNDSEYSAKPFIYDLDTRQCFAENTCSLYVESERAVVCVNACPENLPAVQAQKCVNTCGAGYSVINTKTESAWTKIRAMCVPSELLCADEAAGKSGTGMNCTTKCR